MIKYDTSFFPFFFFWKKGLYVLELLSRSGYPKTQSSASAS
ncbi:rCG51172 [Rattus norvegicus]|uniref:RCG51172 n=1 Tax=Rattus norvegicus TaxID=10116 RepID=A6IZU8_RAT|nr:rCG51172 [Rattus norvegicus]